MNKVAEHKLVNRGPESWLAPTGESVRVQDASDYDLAMALEPESALAGAIAVEIMANRRHFFRSTARGWAAEAARTVRGILGMPKPFTDWLIVETGTHGETIVTVIEEECEAHAVAAYIRGGYASDREITVYRPNAPGAPTRFQVRLASGSTYLDPESYPPRGRCDEDDVYGRSPEDAVHSWAVRNAYDASGEPNAVFELIQGREVVVYNGPVALMAVTIQLPR
jgi:hypothetical protein